jgi:hypothetical protein
MVRTKISPFIKSLLPGGSNNPDRFRQTVLATPSHNLALSLLPYGLTFNSLYITRPNGETEDLLIGPTKPEEHDWQHETGRKFRNQTVGRYANRLPSGKTVLANGEVLELDVIGKSSQGDHEQVRVNSNTIYVPLTPSLLQSQFSHLDVITEILP